MFIPSHNHMITQVFIAAVPAIPTLPRCQLHWRTQLMFRMQGVEAIHFIPAVSQDVIQVMHHQDIVVVTFLRRYTYYVILYHIIYIYIPKTSNKKSESCSLGVKSEIQLLLAGTADHENYWIRRPETECSCQGMPCKISQLWRREQCPDSCELMVDRST